MSVFAIYAFVVTGLYILYMSVSVCMDLFGKKSQKKDGSEEIATGDMVGVDDDDSTFVDETDGGYSTSRVMSQDADVQDVGHSEAAGGVVSFTEPLAVGAEVLPAPDASESPVSSDTVHVDSPEAVAAGADIAGAEYDDVEDFPQRPLDDAEILYYENQSNLEDFESILAAQAEFIDVIPVYQDEYRSDDFASAMVQPISRKSRILRKVVNNNNV